MMYKKLLIAIVCMLTTKILVDASYYTGQPGYNFNYGYQAAAQNTVRRTPAQNSANRNADPLPNQPANMIENLAEMQQIYASQPSNIDKALYISSVLDNDANSITIQQKIDQAKNLLKIIDAQGALYTSWWPTAEEQIEINWLQEQRNKINATIQRFYEQGNSFGINFAWKAAKWTSLYLGIILAAYLAQDQYKIVHPEYKKLEYSDLAWMPIDQLLDLAKAAVVTTTGALTGPTAQKTFGFIASGVSNAVTVTGSTASQIVQKATDKIQKDLHEGAQFIADNVKPTPPTWSDTVTAFLKGKPLPTSTYKANYPKGNVIASQAPSQAPSQAQPQSQTVAEGKQGKEKTAEKENGEPKLKSDADIFDYLGFRAKKVIHPIKKYIDERIENAQLTNINDDDDGKQIQIDRVNKKYLAKEEDYELTLYKKDQDFKRLGLPTQAEQEQTKAVNAFAKQLAMEQLQGNNIKPILQQIQQEQGKEQLSLILQAIPKQSKIIMKENLIAIQQQRDHAAKMELLKKNIKKELKAQAQAQAEAKAKAENKK